MKQLRQAALCSLSIGLFAVADVHAAFESRLGGLAFYDSVLEITWLADADAARGSEFDDGSNDQDGRLSWASAMSWAANLEVAGFDAWQLPSMDLDGDGTVVDCSGASAAACLDNQYGYHFYESDIDSQNPAPFSSVQTTNYWSSTEDGSNAWLFDFTFNDGSQFPTSKTFKAAAWAIHPGDVGVVPLPAAAWLMVAAIGVLLGIGTRRRSHL